MTMEDELIIELLKKLVPFYIEDSTKLISASIIGFEPTRRVQSMNTLDELKKEGLIEIQQPLTQVPKIRLTQKGFHLAHSELQNHNSQDN